MSELSIVPLGTNGFIPTHGRQTMSYLVRRDGVPLLLDAGTGMGRLLEPGAAAAALAGASRLEIVLTHYHLDHVIGLSYLPAVAAKLPVRIWAPAPPLVDGTPEALGNLIAPPLFPIRFAQFPAGVEVVPFAGSTLEVAGARLRLRRQRHAGGSVGVVIDDRLGYLTDCEVDEGSADFARGCDLLLHEVWVTAEEAERGAQRSGHSTVEEVAALARAAGVRSLMPVHHHPTRTPAALVEVLAQLQRLSAVPVIAPLEGNEHRLPGAGR
jgi:ribonuclease BN (tRNA processing enzyme)